MKDLIRKPKPLLCCYCKQPLEPETQLEITNRMHKVCRAQYMKEYNRKFEPFMARLYGQYKAKFKKDRRGLQSKRKFIKTLIEYDQADKQHKRWVDSGYAKSLRPRLIYYGEYDINNDLVMSYLLISEQLSLHQYKLIIFLIRQLKPRVGIINKTAITLNNQEKLIGIIRKFESNYPDLFQQHKFEYQLTKNKPLTILDDILPF